MTAEECIDRIASVLSSGVAKIAPGCTDAPDRLMDISTILKKYYNKKGNK